MIQNNTPGHEALRGLELLSDDDLAIATIGRDRWKGSR